MHVRRPEQSSEAHTRVLRCSIVVFAVHRDPVRPRRTLTRFDSALRTSSTSAGRGGPGSSLRPTTPPLRVLCAERECAAGEDRLWPLPSTAAQGSAQRCSSCLSTPREGSTSCGVTINSFDLTAPPTTLLTRERSAPVMIILIHRVRCHFTNLTFPNPNQRQVLVELKTVPEQMPIAMTLLHHRPF